MNLYLALARQTLLHKELGYLFPVLTLQLDDAAPGVVFDDGTVTIPLFFEVAGDLLEVKVFGETLNNCNALPSSTLLELNMDHLLLTLWCIVIIGLGSTGNEVELVLDFIKLHYLDIVHSQLILILIFIFHTVIFVIL